MSFAVAVPAQVSEWGWLFGFAVVSLALVALAVLADALYEGYREKIRQHREAVGPRGGERQPGQKPKQAA